MKFLVDASETKALDGSFPDIVVTGQLLTPLTRYRRWHTTFAIDNGAFSKFNRKAWESLLRRESEHRGNCLFVCCPDVVGSARRTNELFKVYCYLIRSDWKVAYVAQDGSEDMDIPWDLCNCLFLGGRDPWKDSQAAQDIVKTALALGKHVHIGRVNAVDRYILYAKLGAHTCDGSGISRYPKAKLPAIETAARELFHLLENVDERTEN
ncbi:MAG: hypothetical protein ACK5S6_00920 [bacterium]|jgi:hypothetical protein